MIIVRLRGGLGNQMFQYAMGRRIANDLGTSLKLDLTSLLKTYKSQMVTNRDYQLDIFNLEPIFLIQPDLLIKLDKLGLNFVSQFIKGIKLLGIKKYREKTFTVEDWIVENPKDNFLYSGYWQSEKYFKSAEDLLRKDFQFKDILSPQAQDIFDKIKSENAVCVHMRRGDYVDNPVFNSGSLDYFTSAANYINEHTEKPHFFVFSDDPEWCLKNVKFEQDFTIVDYKTNKIKFKEDLQLMSSCEHFVMSASSFSWWAVWLSNKEGNIVVAPKPWFLNSENDVKDLVSKRWIRL
ncbi:alpha-1,2-fucosyltransferase [Psychroserpens sp. Hel_I_66]|uniref:alpha-1,2-fucosyltransferase n=1 Tax=Psychroserpens sp. Hel_I_66 TaxID=1250004 RepID=UPI0006922238|nr:alpha-1,2-fucosyltransferase [Psychroserpens sp. Hel_I_66]